MAGFTSSIGGQLSNLARAIRSFVRKTLLDFGRRFRARMNRERIGGNGSTLNVITGKLKRSLRYALVDTPTGFRLDAEIGGGGAGYASEHEEFGRLEFENTFDQEAQKTMSEISSGLEFFSRNPNVAPSGAENGGVTVENDGAGGDAQRAALLSGLRNHFENKRQAAKLRRQRQWRSIRRGA